MKVRLTAAMTAIVVVSSGCAAWTDHNETTKETRTAFEAGRYEEAFSALESEVDNKLDGLCFRLDRGVIAQVGGMFEKSAAEFEKCEAKIEYFEDRGITGASIAEDVGAFAVNEKTIPYQGEAFEKVLVPVLGARNYLFRAQFEDAMVEVRKVYFQQDQVRKLHEKEIETSNNKADEEKIDRSKMGDVEGKVQYDPALLKSPESVYEITYAHWLSALIAERMQNFNDAYISMKATARIRGNLPFVQQDLVRYARIMGMDEDVEEYKRTYPSVKLPGKDDGSVTLLFDCGWAPHKKELKFVLPGFNTLGAVAIPLYEKTPNPAAFARIHVGRQVFETYVLSDVNAIAFKYHKNRLPLMVLKQIIRTTLKVAAGEASAAAVRHGAGSELGGLAAGLAVGIYNVASEQADLRAWLTLPETFQGCRAWVAPGTYDVKVDLCGPNGNVLNSKSLGQITVKPRSARFVSARSLGTTLHANLLQEAADKAPPEKKAPERKPAETTKTQDLRQPSEPAKKKPAVETTRVEDRRKPDAPATKTPPEEPKKPADEEPAVEPKDEGGAGDKPLVPEEGTMPPAKGSDGDGEGGGGR